MGVAKKVEEESISDGHPYGVRPLGNMFFSESKNCRDVGLGDFTPLPDVVVSEILSYLPAKDLCRVSPCSRALYGFSHSEELWKALTLFGLREDGKFFYTRNWKQTYLVTYHASKHGSEAGAPVHEPIQIDDLFSDTLYHPFRDATMKIPSKWTKVDNVDRVSAKNLTKEEFIEKYEKPGIPVVITDLVTEWPAFKLWDWPYLLENFGKAEFQCEAAKLSFEEFHRYSEGQNDDRPLYLFDANFTTTVPEMRQHFTVPTYFDDDLFKVLGKDRPNYRWLIMGPARSGSSFHIDPNSTDAWNACLRGTKKWVFFPPTVVPPGVIPSEDGADVTSPMSLIEWFSNYYDRVDEVKVRPLEALVKPGEMMFIPHTWWHLCLNLTPTCCITQNYVSCTGLPRVLTFLRDKKHCVSGICDEQARDSLYDRFRSALADQMPDLLSDAEKAEVAEKQQLETWSTAMEGASAEGFSFTF